MTTEEQMKRIHDKLRALFPDDFIRVEIGVSMFPGEDFEVVAYVYAVVCGTSPVRWSFRQEGPLDEIEAEIDKLSAK